MGPGAGGGAAPGGVGRGGAQLDRGCAAGHGTDPAQPAWRASCACSEQSSVSWENVLRSSAAAPQLCVLQRTPTSTGRTGATARGWRSCCASWPSWRACAGSASCEPAGERASCRQGAPARLDCQGQEWPAPPAAARGDAAAHQGAGNDVFKRARFARPPAGTPTPLISRRSWWMRLPTTPRRGRGQGRGQGWGENWVGCEPSRSPASRANRAQGQAALRLTPSPPSCISPPPPPAGLQVHRHAAAAHLQPDAAGHEPAAAGAFGRGWEGVGPGGATACTSWPCRPGVLLAWPAPSFLLPALASSKGGV